MFRIFRATIKKVLLKKMLSTENVGINKIELFFSNFYLFLIRKITFFHLNENIYKVLNSMGVKHPEYPLGIKN